MYVTQVQWSTPNNREAVEYSYNVKDAGTVWDWSIGVTPSQWNTSMLRVTFSDPDDHLSSAFGNQLLFSVTME